MTKPKSSIPQYINYPDLQFRSALRGMLKSYVSSLGKDKVYALLHNETVLMYQDLMKAREVKNEGN